MDFKPVDKTIKDLLISGHPFEIPRFQRAYSWEKRHYAEFLQDITSNLKIENGQIVPDAYFVGTMLFIGNFIESGKSVIKVVDGQQRLTTITILFSVLSDLFKKKGEVKLSQVIFRYIMAQDDNGENVRILKTKSNYPYFAYFIQDYDKSQNPEPASEEEENIKQTYEYFYKQLEERKLRQTLKKTHGSDVVNTLAYVDILKAIRDQVLSCSFVSISTETGDQANRIFEILNAKGKRLNEVDLIKNKLFEVVSGEEPVDVANDYWTRIRNKIEDVESGVGIATFYRHFWAANYTRSSSGKLYEVFKKSVKPANRQRYVDFLKEMLVFAEYYSQIVEPSLAHYNNRQEYRWLVQSLKELTDTFNIVQVRVPLMALMNAKKKDLISMAYYKKAVTYLENFHFAFNVVVSDRGNKLDSFYSTFAVSLKGATSKNEAHKMIDELLIGKLEPLFPNFSKFEDGFVKFSFSKEKNPGNVKAKYALYKLNSVYTGDEIFEQGMTVEHIASESESVSNRAIGNLILLENSLNGEAGEQDYQTKKAVYVKSNSPWIAEFMSENVDWDASKFNERSKRMAKDYYEKVFGKRVG